jgi:arylsulfatase I/J
LALLGTVETSKPHIIHIIADDYGWADVGYHRNDPKDALPEVITPVLDELARTGLELDRFYMHKICSPSRCAIQSGRHPINVNVQNVVPEVSNSADLMGGYQGIPTNMTTIATVLKGGGYATHMVGKWDVGMATEQHHPKARGFDTWLGYWHHSNDYWKQTQGKCGLKPVHDLWNYTAAKNGNFFNSRTERDSPAAELRNGPSCSQVGLTVVTLLLHCCYTVATLLLHCCYTVATLLLHYCSSIVTLLLHYCYIVVILQAHCCHTVVTLLLHYCYTVVTLLLHTFYTVATLLLHCCYTGVRRRTKHRPGRSVCTRSCI